MPYTAEEFMRAFNVPQPTPKKKRAAKPKREISIACLADALGFVPPDDYDKYLYAGMGLHYEFSGDETGFELWCEWSAGCREKYSEEVQRTKWDSFGNRDGELITGQTILKMARDNGWDEGAYEFRDVWRDLAIILPPPSTPKPGQQHPLLEFGSDISIAALIAHQESAIVAGLLSPGDQGMIFGEFGTGKTFIAVNLGHHVALGKPWYGRDVKRVPVLYVCLEGVAGFQKRVVAAQRQLGDPGAYFARLRPHVSLNKSEAGKAGADQIIAACEAQRTLTGQNTGLIFIDTQVRATAGDDENAAADMMHYLENRAGELARKTGAAVVTVHHPNKQGEMRGSTALRGGLDLILKVEGGNLIADKVKDDAEGPLFSFKLEPVTLAHGPKGRPLTSCTVSHSAPVSKSEPVRVSKAERVLHAVFAEQVAKGTAVSRVEGSAEVRVDLAELRRAFIARYAAGPGIARNAFLRLRKNLPSGFSLGCDDADTEYLTWTQ